LQKINKGVEAARKEFLFQQENAFRINQLTWKRKTKKLLNKQKNKKLEEIENQKEKNLESQNSWQDQLSQKLVLRTQSYFPQPSLS
jgi:hypothetical protein